jgi:hypothetical protein
MGVGGKRYASGRFTPGQETRYTLYMRLDGPPSTTEIKNEWSCTSTPLIRPDDVNRGNFTFYLLIIPNFTASFKRY